MNTAPYFLSIRQHKQERNRDGDRPPPQQKNGTPKTAMIGAGAYVAAECAWVAVRHGEAHLLELLLQGNAMNLGMPGRGQGMTEGEEIADFVQETMIIIGNGKEK